ncbi:hypothetical protein [Limosilactobacillus pontis]|nr:hypothetical protein [Limosilactobacillus pontis]
MYVTDVLFPYDICYQRSVSKRGEVIMALSKQERKEMARKAMEKRGNKKPDGSGFAKLDEEAKKLSD